MSEAPLGDLLLESGEKIPDFRQSYVTHGALNSEKSNAVLICSSLTGNHRRLDFLIGAGLALDPARYFIVATDAIGNGLSTSPSNSPRQPKMSFPRFTIRDMVSAQHRLLVEHLGIGRLHAIAGASMGGMQALQWAVSHPRFMQSIVAMTPMARTTPWTARVVQAARACLMADPAWNGREFEHVPERGWIAYNGLMNGLLMRTPAALQPTLSPALPQGGGSAFDAHDYLYQSWAYEAHDVGGASGDTDAALRSIVARSLILAPPLDLFNPAQAAREAAAQIPGARFVDIPSDMGHLAATATKPEDAAFLNRVIGEFLRP
jgi:homoserine O-acetyltransferase/O-succinyltransferase